MQLFTHAKQFWLSLTPLARGLLCMIIALLLFTMMDAIAKGLMQKYPPMQIVWARYASQTFWSFLGFAPFLHKYLRTKQLKMQMVRSSTLFVGTMCFFMSLKYLELAEATAIFEISPLFLTILSVVILKEKVGPRRALAVVLGFVGALVIIRPGTDAFSPYALFAVVAALAFAAYGIATRFLGQDESPVTSFLYTALIGTIMASFIVIPFWQPVANEDIWILATFGMIGGTGHFLLILAFRSTPASILAPFNYISLLYSIIWGVLFFGEFPDLATLGGASIIIGSGLYVWYRERELKSS